MADDQEPAHLGTSPVPAHPLGIKPLGNQYLHDGVKARAHIGGFEALPDELLVRILELLDHESLRLLGYTCRFLYAHSLAEDIWKAIFLESPLGKQASFAWLGSWRATVLGLPEDRQLKLDCSNVFSDVLHRPHVCSHVPLGRYAATIPPANRISRLDALSYADFADKWVDQPFILTDCVPRWPVARSWSVDRLLELYPGVPFRAEAVDWTFSAYCQYMRNSHDESPVYLFDHKFAESMGVTVGEEEAEQEKEGEEKEEEEQENKGEKDRQGKEERADSAAYWRPACFGPDLFGVLGAERPVHRWLIVGPARSGSSFHKDPNGTSAWNAVLRGSKYWVLFPPDAAVPGVYASADGAEVTSPLSIAEWLLGFHHAATRAGGNTRAIGRRRGGGGSGGPSGDPNGGPSGGLRCVEAVCGPGELLHVPSGWWHLVLNLEPDTVALTQNFVPPPLLAGVLAFMHDRPEQVSGFAEGVADPYSLFLDRLRERHPDLLRTSLEQMEKTRIEKAAEGEEGGEEAGGKKKRKKKRRWDQLVGRGDDDDEDADEDDDGGGGERPPQKKASSGFSFGFGFDGDDGDWEEEEEISDPSLSSRPGQV